MATTAMDLSHAHRILLVIDLHPLLAQNPNPNPYITSIIAAIRVFLSSLPPATLTAFKAIFSSLSPILSTSLSHRLFGKAPFSLSFDLPSRTLASLCESLGSLPTFSHPNAKPRASALVQSLLQIDEDYAWDSGISDSEGMRQSLTFPSNLVVFFSPFPRNLRSLFEFFDLEVGDDDKLLSWDVFSKKFTQAFVPVNERFMIKGIHLCWIDVNFDTLSKKEENLGFVFLKKGIKETGWGCYSTDAIVLGSSLLPFGLIFPEIACKTGWFPASGNSKKGNLELILEVTDVSGNPLKCKICDLEVLDVMPLRDRSDWNNDFFRNKDNGTKTIHIRKVFRDIQVGKMMDSPCSLFLLHGISRKLRKDGEEHSTNEFFADKVLELLCAEHGGFAAGKPAWQILIAFFYKRSFAALVSIVDEGSSIEGLLMPLTVNYAVLCIAKNGPMNLNQLLMIARNCSSESITSGIGFDSGVKNDRRKRKRVNSTLPSDISWGSFRELVFSQVDGCALGFELEEVYFAKELNKAKKLQFLKCWMRQIKESNEVHQLESNEVMAVPKARERNEAESGSPIKPELQLVSPSSAGQACPSRSVTEDASVFSTMRDVETFFISIPQKIEHGLHSEQSDLGFLAERLICLCIQAVSKKFAINTEGESVPVQPEDASDVKIAAEVSCLLLQKPKELLLKYKGCKPASTASDPKSAPSSTEEKIREHELQILLRMEILRSKVGEGIEDNLKQKMVKDICSLLQNIEFDLEKDLFHGESLVHFAGRTIKSRWSSSRSVMTLRHLNPYPVATMMNHKNFKTILNWHSELQTPIILMKSQIHRRPLIQITSKKKH
ncbi:Treslin protein [Dioscorea alata]|uniref:Treslin protein n=1 Tax=Dioscorea alata TaxID=55571 RepID=A0ACB7W4P0_DIOAL|nr:Treslin protein [Dioscorea alata]